MHRDATLSVVWSILIPSNLLRVFNSFYINHCREKHAVRLVKECMVISKDVFHITSLTTKTVRPMQLKIGQTVSQLYLWTGSPMLLISEGITAFLSSIYLPVSKVVKIISKIKVSLFIGLEAFWEKLCRSIKIVKEYQFCYRNIFKLYSPQG